MNERLINRADEWHSSILETLENPNLTSEYREDMTECSNLLAFLIKRTKQSIEHEQENETLRSANEDLIKENRTLKNFKRIDVEHPSNTFF